MEKIVYKRGLAYLIDISIISLLLLLALLIMPNTNDFRSEIGNLNETFLNEEISEKEYLNQLVTLNHQTDLEKKYETLLSISLIVFFFMIIPMKIKKTIGQLLVGIKIKSKNLNLKQLFIRAVVVNGLLYSIICVILMFFVSSIAYFSIITILGILQVIITIKSFFMILLNKDHKGLQDIWSNTEIVLEEEIR